MADNSLNEEIRADIYIDCAIQLRSTLPKNLKFLAVSAGHLMVEYLLLLVGKTSLILSENYLKKTYMYTHEQQCRSSKEKERVCCRLLHVHF